MTEFEIIDGHGFANIPTGGVLTFEIQGISEREELREKEFQSLYAKYITEQMTMRLDDFVVPLWGEGHNLYPQQIFSTTSENKLLPEVINKQVNFIFGKGPRLFQEVQSGEGEKRRAIRIPVEVPVITEWLESWEEKGYNHYWDYLKNLITDYYYVNTCISQYEFSRSRRLAGRSTNMIPIMALSYIGSDQARLATKKDPITNLITNKDCNYVIVGDWMNPNRFGYEVFNRFNPAEPLRYPAAIAFTFEKTFTKNIYPQNNWFKGLFEWIKASNLSPKYLNSYLKNALNAHIHVVIPGSWYNKQRDILQAICLENQTGDLPVQNEYRGVKLIDENGTKIQFYETMVDQVIANELKSITKFLTGEGKNQGKLWASTRWAQDDGWEFKEFPGKFKEYFESVLSLDRRADEVILAGKGISPSITNVEKDGTLSKSGSDVYYNYLIYVNQLHNPQEFILREINRAIHLNFPEAKKLGIKLGFWIDIPAKLQDTTPADRPAATATADTKSNLQKTQEQ